MINRLLAADFTWFNWIPGYNEWSSDTAQSMGKGVISGELGYSMTNIVLAGVVLLIIMGLVAMTRASWSKSDNPAIPQTGFGPRNFLEVVMDYVLSQAETVLGSKQAAQRFLPLVGALAIYIFVSNVLGLVPGFLPPTDALNVTIGPAIVVFFVTHYVGLKENGMHYLEHFLGPKIGGFWWLFPLFVPLEIISHVARPVSLALRLMGNMIGDHQVLALFSSLIPFSILIPLPFYMLGLIVCSVQTLVFCMLTLVYFAVALEHSEEGH